MGVVEKLARLLSEKKKKYTTSKSRIIFYFVAFLSISSLEDSLSDSSEQLL